MTLEYPPGLQPLTQADARPTLEHHLFLMGLVDGVNANSSETGTGANGRWWRFQNGLQVCVSLSNDGPIDLNTALGALWRSDDITWIFPQPFVSAPFVEVHRYGAVADARIITATHRNLTVSSIVYRHLSLASLTGETVATMRFAVGRWK